MIRFSKPAFDRKKLLVLGASGVALTEFAVALPFLLLVGTGGLEAANFAINWRRVSDLTTQVADNASRLGAESVLANRPITEGEINTVMLGANLQAGNGLNLAQHGRIVLSSLEVNPDGGQWVRWQRCHGGKVYTPRFGREGDGATGTTVAGMGSTGSQVRALPGSAVMFVEVVYRYQPLFSMGSLNNRDIVETASFNVRGARDLGSISNAAADTVATCA